ncbi:MAG: hypothetical protein J7L80_02985 [Thermoplasmata archaeon]|nr:hypothetical protein [Thermoplasmata archaeon]
MNENEAHIILTKMKFKYKPEKKLFYKNIVPSGDARGDKYTLFARYKNGEIEMWLNPRNDLIFPTLGEVKAVKAIIEGRLDAKTWNVDEPLTIENAQGGKEIIELTPTPEDLAKEPKETEKPKESKESKVDDYLKKLIDITEYDIFEIFSDSGSGKSKIALEIARNAISHGYKVFFYDTENNITNEEAGMFKDNYIYSPDMNDLINFKFPNVDLLIIDSVTYPFWIAFSSMNRHERGEALLSLHSFFGRLKVWCKMNKKVAIVTSQPISEIAEERRPWGGKAFHIAKEIAKPEMVYSKPHETLIKLLAYRMRRHGRGFEIAEVVISDKGVNIKWKI